MPLRVREVLDAQVYCTNPFTHTLAQKYLINTWSFIHRNAHYLRLIFSCYHALATLQPCIKSVLSPHALLMATLNCFPAPALSLAGQVTGYTVEDGEGGDKMVSECGLSVGMRDGHDRITR